MKRRSFLGLLAGALAAPSVKATEEITVTTPKVPFSVDRVAIRSVKAPLDLDIGKSRFCSGVVGVINGREYVIISGRPLDTRNVIT